MPSSTTCDLSEDPDMEDALKGFDFLASPDELDGSAAWRSGEDSGDGGEGQAGAAAGVCDLELKEERCSSGFQDACPPVPSIPPSSRPAEGEELAPVGELSWDVDQGLIAQLKEQYRKERRGKKGVKSKSVSSLLSGLSTAGSHKPLIVNDVAMATTASGNTGLGGTPCPTEAGWDGLG